MEKEEQIKNLLMEIESNPRKLLELGNYYSRDIVEVAFKYKLYEQLMLTFKPVEIDGEVRICCDAFSTDILRLLQTACETKEEAEQLARKEYDNIQKANSKLSEEDREFFYNNSTYDDILKSKTIIPKEIKDAFKKILFTIDYEQISKMKIKNCHARQISGWNHPVEIVEDVMIYSELPCLSASIDLFNRNIKTTMNDTEGVFEDSPVDNGICKIWFEYNSLSDENKDIVEGLIESGNAKMLMDGNRETVSIFVPCSSEATVGEVSDRLMDIVSKLKVQDIKYGFGTIEEIYESYLPLLERYPFFSKGLFQDGINIPDLIKLGNKLGDNLYYDEDENLLWKSPELYQRHKKYIDSMQARSS